MAAVERDEPLQLFPLAVYVVTHELVHVVRFCKFLQRFDAEPLERQQEVGTPKIPHLDYVLEAYSDYQYMEQLRDHVETV
jgi:hypothetical protein